MHDLMFLLSGNETLPFPICIWSDRCYFLSCKPNSPLVLEKFPNWMEGICLSWMRWGLIPWWEKCLQVLWRLSLLRWMSLFLPQETNSIHLWLQVSGRLKGNDEAKSIPFMSCLLKTVPTFKSAHRSLLVSNECFLNSLNSAICFLHVYAKTSPICIGDTLVFLANFLQFYRYGKDTAKK